MGNRLMVLVTVLGTLGLSACANIKTVPLSDALSSSLNGKSIVLAARFMPPFGLMSSSRILAGALAGGGGIGIAASAGINAGRELARQEQFEDPAVLAGKSLLGELAGKYQMTIVDSAGLVTDGQKPEEIIKPYGKVDLVLDVETVNWSTLYLPMHMSKYGIAYATRLRLINVKTAKALAAASCIHRPESATDAPTYDELLANHAAKIKELSISAAQKCLKELRLKAFANGQ